LRNTNLRKYNLWLITICGCLLFGSCRSNKVTLDSLLEEMVDREHLTIYPSDDYKLCQFSSYNRRSVSPGQKDWFANADMSHFIRIDNRSGRREFVMMDTDGPGAVVRWWMTFYKAQDGIIRIYIDNDTVPLIYGTPRQLLRGNQVTVSPLAAAVQEGAPLGEEGRDYDHNFYVPLPFKKHCMITYECDSLRLRYEYEGIPVPEGYWWPDVFYNIDCRIYTGKTEVVSLTRHELGNEAERLAAAGRELLNNDVISTEERPFSEKINPGDSAVIRISGKGQAINRLLFSIEAENKPQALRSTIIRADFDGFNTIWVPAGEFFGAGYLQDPHSTWMNRVSKDGTMESFWLMPFRENCTLSFINFGNESIDITGMAGLIRYDWKPESMYFGSSWHEYHMINTRDSTGSPFDLNFIDIRGKGVYAGDQVTLFNSTFYWWGEGDEKIYVDGESFPSSFGTGTEDYYGYSFGREEPFSHPFISQPSGRGNMSAGSTINMRHRSLDAIPFRRSISSNIELWHWANVKINYALTTYYYVLTPFTVNIEHDIESVRRSVVLSKIDFTLGDK
jgi:hypothetical protein